MHNDGRPVGVAGPTAEDATLRLLRAYDERSGTEFAETLVQYRIGGYSFAARVLGIQRSTARYRMHRIRELLDEQAGGDADGRFDGPAQRRLPGSLEDPGFPDPGPAARGEPSPGA
ncbi:helix-turn-helix domain-containing protein [Pseudonocardia sp. H11422]|uniref:helix-turn-helix domain-containing protein n=1 Tax=Pseudonocardia sp. H11422 TaxID=2835866 RepID=UPI001BDBF2C4|nr:helix-turn-helix domain-containing protein [Pseudonocardia sp. H11422]